jgi:hypothetical protein
VLGPFDYALWIVSFFLEVAVVLCAVYRRDFSRYLSLNVYMLGAVAVQCATYVSFTRFGSGSAQYHFVYYYLNSLLAVLMFFVVIQLYQKVFAQMNASAQIRRTATFLLVGASCVSYFIVREHRANLTDHFVVQLGQNLYFIGLVLTYILWAAVLKLGETRRRLVHFVLALGIYFSGTAGAYALRNLFPSLQPLILHWIPPIAGTWLPLAWAYTLLRVPEDARFALAHLAAKPQDPPHIGSLQPRANGA